MKKFHLLLASAALLPALPAYAQDNDGDEIVVVASGVEQAASETGRAVTLIDRAKIEQRQSVVLSDLLATTPGVNVSRNGGVGNFTGVRVRGAEAEQTLVLIDGVRVNDPSSPAGTFDFGNLLTGSIERVEVLRGPNSVVWGSQAIGGVVNVVTQSGEDGFHARGNAEYGSFDTLSANAALAAGNDHVSGALTAGYFTSDGISAFAGGTEPDGYRQYGASGRVKVMLSPQVRAEVRGYFADSRTDLDGFQFVTPFAQIDTAEYSTARELYGYAGIEVDLFDGMLSNKLSFTAGDIDRDNFDPAFGTAPVFLGRGSSERYAYQGDLKPADWLRAVFGVEREDSRFTDGFTPASTLMTSGYGQMIVTPIDAVTLTGGARHDDHRTYGSHTTLALSGVFRAGSDTLIRANYNEGFKAPTLYQLFGFFGDPTLQPETSKSYEVGAEQKLMDGRVKLAATWFHRDTTNQIDFDLGLFQYQNLAQTRAQGIELSVTAQPTEGLSIEAMFTHVKAQNRTPGGNFGNDLARRPRDVASLSVDYGFGFGLKIGGTLLVVGDSFDDAGNFARLDGYALVSLRAEMPVSERIAVYGRVENVFDERYQTVGGYGTAGRAAFGGIRLRFY